MYTSPPAPSAKTLLFCRRTKLRPWDNPPFGACSEFPAQLNKNEKTALRRAYRDVAEGSCPVGAVVAVKCKSLEVLWWSGTLSALPRLGFCSWSWCHLSPRQGTDLLELKRRGFTSCQSNLVSLWITGPCSVTFPGTCHPIRMQEAEDKRAALCLGWNASPLHTHSYARRSYNRFSLQCEMRPRWKCGEPTTSCGVPYHSFTHPSIFIPTSTSTAGFCRQDNWSRRSWKTGCHWGCHSPAQMPNVISPCRDFESALLLSLVNGSYGRLCRDSWVFYNNFVVDKWVIIFSFS